MKFKNRKALTGIVVSAAVLSMGTVGFSAWVVFGVHTETQDIGTLGVNVATVSDYHMQISNPAWSGTFAPSDRDATVAHDATQVTMIEDSKAQICFGPRQGDQEGSIRADGNGKGDLEHLTLEFTFKVQCRDFENHFDKLDVSFVFGAASGEKQSWGDTLKEAATAGYITNPFLDDYSPVTVLQGEPTAESDLVSVSGANGLIKRQCVSISGEEAIFKVRLAWGWGATFNNDNPSVHADQNDGTNLQSLINKINGLNTILAKGDGTITVKVAAVGK